MIYLSTPGSVDKLSKHTLMDWTSAIFAGLAMMFTALVISVGRPHLSKRIAKAVYLTIALDCYGSCYRARPKPRFAVRVVDIEYE